MGLTYLWPKFSQQEYLHAATTMLDAKHSFTELLHAFACLPLFNDRLSAAGYQHRCVGPNIAPSWLNLMCMMTMKPAITCTSALYLAAEHQTYSNPVTVCWLSNDSRTASLVLAYRTAGFMSLLRRSWLSLQIYVRTLCCIIAPPPNC